LHGPTDAEDSVRTSVLQPFEHIQHDIEQKVVSQMDPLLIAIILGWILSVCVHEYAHAASAYAAGDRSVAQRGYLTMNPLSYIDPLTSLLIPVMALWMGGIALPGGAVQIEKAALRKRQYASLVALAGPATNLTLFLIFAALIHPRLGLVGASYDVRDWPAWALFAGTMAFLQIFAVMLNLLPVPPFDGYHIVEPFLSVRLRMRLSDPQVQFVCLLAVLFLLWQFPPMMRLFFAGISTAFQIIGIPWQLPAACYNLTFFGG